MAFAWWENVRDRIDGKAPKGAKRSGSWRRVRANHLASDPNCAVCGSMRRLTVHHCVPFHIAPDLELEPDNLITLCQKGRFSGLDCHLIFGHLGNFRGVNPMVRGDAAAWSFRLGRGPR